MSLKILLFALALTLASCQISIEQIRKNTQDNFNAIIERINEMNQRIRQGKEVSKNIEPTVTSSDTLVFEYPTTSVPNTFEQVKEPQMLVDPLTLPSNVPTIAEHRKHEISPTEEEGNFGRHGHHGRRNGRGHGRKGKRHHGKGGEWRERKREEWRKRHENRGRWHSEEREGRNDGNNLEQGQGFPSLGAREPNNNRFDFGHNHGKPTFRHQRGGEIMFILAGVSLVLLVALSIAICFCCCRKKKATQAARPSVPVTNTKITTAAQTKPLLKATSKPAIVSKSIGTNNFMHTTSQDFNEQIKLPLLTPFNRFKEEDHESSCPLHCSQPISSSKTTSVLRPVEKPFYLFDKNGKCIYKDLEKSSYKDLSY